MSRVQSLPADFNHNLVMTDNGSRVSSFGGLVMVREFMDKIQWDCRIAECVPFEDWRVRPTHAYKDLLSLGALQRVAGFATDTSMKYPAAGPNLAQSLGWPLASPSHHDAILSNLPAKSAGPGRFASPCFAIGQHQVKAHAR
jgi:hypothetical protein